VRFQVEVPDDVFGKLATVAEKQDVRISQLLAGPLMSAISAVLNGDRPRQPRRAPVVVTPEMQERIVELVELGRSWPDVATELGISYENAMRWGRKLGIRSRRQQIQGANAVRRTAAERNAA
jgi:hypothetical protein